MAKARLKLDEVYAWYSEQIDKPVKDFDDGDRKLAVEAYMENLQKAVRSNLAPENKVDKVKRRERSIKRQRRRPF